MAGNSETRRQLRREKVKLERVDRFVSNYVKHKYPMIHAEAVQFNDMLRQKNPWKLDLKKTHEYRKWISQQAEQVNTPQLPGRFNNFQLKVRLMDSNNIQEKAKNSSVETLAEGDAKNSSVETLAEGDAKNSSVEILAEGDAKTSSVETLAEGDAKNSSVEILAEGDAKNSTIEMAMCETLGEGTIEPSLEGFIPSELFEQIVNELRQDLDLDNIMTSIEEQIHYEEFDIGMDIDISNDDRLEMELL